MNDPDFAYWRIKFWRQMPGSRITAIEKADFGECLTIQQSLQSFSRQNYPLYGNRPILSHH